MRKQLAGTVVGAVLMASCGAVGGGDGVSDDLSEADKSRIAEEWQNCMAEGGLEAEIQYDDGLDISVGGGPEVTEEDMLATEANCEPILEQLENGTGPQLTPEEQAQMADANFEVADCLAEDGYVVIPSEDGLDMNGDDQPEDFDEDVYAEAEAACFKEAVPELWAKYGPESE